MCQCANSCSNSPVGFSVDESGTRSKRKKLKSTSDKFCWRCHKEPVDVYCTACPRSWHRKCIGGTPPSPQKWICGECANILTAENAETRSMAMAQLSVDQLCMMLRYVVQRLREYPGVRFYLFFFLHYLRCKKYFAVHFFFYIMAFTESYAFHTVGTVL